MAAQLLAYVLLGLHFVILAYLVFGGFVAWKWPRTLFAHIPLVVWGVVSSVFQLDCPVTEAENWARSAGGMAQYDHGFIETYIAGVFYDPHHVNRFRAVVGFFVAVGWVGSWWYARRRRAVRRLLTTAVSSPPRVPVK
ncbi:DUF2784 domain-containing protein [Amycolatopsis jejuensis]|uniref:DUF2784 domain-containing protein n=1 Tax=Amycolatopsis jejuensis TaxID=330084 RepID=UPI00069097B5|nr:DUF2784 domain-containing protein [Amycolatopsis jejuensis]